MYVRRYSKFVTPVFGLAQALPELLCMATFVL